MPFKYVKEGKSFDALAVQLEIAHQLSLIAEALNRSTEVKEKENTL